MSESVKGKAVITGASSGIGAVYADRLARRGYDLILVARNKERLQTLAERLKQETGRSIETFVADLTSKTDLSRVESLLQTDAGITMLVNNAGVAALTPLLSSNVDKMDEIISLNIGALTRLAYAVVPKFVERGSGTIINMSSVVAIMPEMLNGVYSASKAYVLAFSRSLYKELADQGIRIQAVLPGATATEIWDLAGMPVTNLPKEIVMTTEHMVDAALAGFDQGEFITIPALPELSSWDAFETARQALAPQLSLATPAKRYAGSQIAAE